MLSHALHPPEQRKRVCFGAAGTLVVKRDPSWPGWLCQTAGMWFLGVHLRGYASRGWPCFVMKWGTSDTVLFKAKLQTASENAAPSFKQIINKNINKYIYNNLIREKTNQEHTTGFQNAMCFLRRKKAAYITSHHSCALSLDSPCGSVIFPIERGFPRLFSAIRRKVTALLLSIFTVIC